MSNLTNDTRNDCELMDACGAVKMVLKPKDTDLGGFSVRRLLPTAQLKMIGPWIFFDHMGPASFAPGPGINVRPHPHIGIATVTYLFAGEILHRDSLASVQPIKPGDINLMVSGSGIVHSERERPEATEHARNLNGLQLWLALPKEQEEMEPAFYHYSATSVPLVHIDGVPVRVMMGSAYGVESPVRTFSNTLYLEAVLKPGESLTLPPCAELGLYVVRGHLQAKDTDIPEHCLAVFSDTHDISAGVTVTASQDSRIALIGGEPLGKRFIEWNFVSSRKERIDQAKDDWQNGRFAKVPGDEQEFIPLP
ncbi:pirin family protein [Pseudoalteromonas sp. T1lg48]|uniref:pirin family protein n=1 Tax=Pseudoalteromonas sp. T1lg48 TaxID=2077100 RepID=UPI000CF5E92A|nr:pirin family protein [Pseudoalteromonas sp. T1lg48]